MACPMSALGPAGLLVGFTRRCEDHVTFDGAATPALSRSSCACIAAIVCGALLLDPGLVSSSNSAAVARAVFVLLGAV